MAVKIRLSRIGTTNRPYYRVVATDGRNKRDGEILANVGTYDPMNNTVVQFHEDIYQTWLSQGAIATDSAKKVYRLFKNSVKPATTAPVVEKAVVTEKAAE
ncbi:MAG TPA: 30S ribosomal protein S16 [Candidatus Babeliales bacterium]|jgi:small subunit ribosomal protein S16|nr:30S ribosomal protein S16 [Candidatus Babeliales bacterium]